MLYATIMAGGAGTRFWPASRKQTPKQLLKLVGERSMLQSTVDRLEGLCDGDHLLIVTNESLVDPIAEQLPQVPRESVIGEPAKRDTAPCVALAAALVFNTDPEATMVVMPADHVIQPREVFQQALAHAAQLVAEDPTRIITFGIRPTYPAEVFGYIERGESIEGCEFPTFRVRRFREKPDAATAREFLDAGTFYWNSGIFVWKAATILDALRQFEPDMMAHVQKISDSIETDHFEDTLQSEFCAIKGISIDYAVMERYQNVLVVESPFEWDDLGNWTAVPRVSGTDEQGNSVSGRHLSIKTSNSIIHAEGEHLVVTVGMDDCIVVHTPDATLVANKKDEAAIREIVAELEKRQWNSYL
jgi:mannose-1-phosphate guanylyltransferase